MKLTFWKNRLITSCLFAVLILALPGIFTACQDLGYPPPTPTPQAQPEPARIAGPTVIKNKDAALLAVYQRLLSLAESYEAKTYVADFYSSCDNWTASPEFFKDGSGTWYVVVDMTCVENQELKPYWQQAAWLVFKDGKVIPYNRHQANALRIEADLLKLSGKTAPDNTELSG